MYLYKFIKNMFVKDRETNIAECFYESIVSMSRNSLLYKNAGIPDTLDGRYELIVLHSHLIISRLREVNPNGKDISQKLLEVIVKDFENSLRELGVGDLSVGKKVRKMIEGYYGRANSYRDFDKEIEARRALRRNLYGTVKPTNEQLDYIWQYIFNLTKDIKILSDKEFLNNFLKYTQN